MERFVDIAVELGARLKALASSDKGLEVIERAVAENPWFSPAEVVMSIEAISSQMLDEQKLRAWMAHYPTLPTSTPRNVGIIMAGNIPLVGFFDLLCTLAAGHRAWIKPSSKDRVLMEYICSLLREIDPDIPIYIYGNHTQIDAIIATGGHEANRHFEQEFANHKRLLRSSRHSIAVISNELSECQTELLAEDIYAYSALGCRNVSMIFAPRGCKVELPAYPTSPKYHNCYLQSRALHTMRGDTFEDNGSLVMIRSKEFPQSLGEISIWEYDSIEQVEEWITEHDKDIQCIVSQIIDHPRSVDFGQAQHPTLLDYADGVDTMQFLTFND
ncbi:MAG: acyl-CoA reductase [Rikenellaceae bacterium]